MRKIIFYLFFFVSFQAFATPLIVYVNGASNENDSNIDGSFSAFVSAASTKYAKIPREQILPHKVYQTKIGSIAAVACQKTLSEISLPDGFGSVYLQSQKNAYLYNLGKNYASIFNFGIIPQCNGLIYSASYIRDRTLSLFKYVKENLDNGVVLVGHSQGNFLIEAVLGLLYYTGHDIDKVRLVNIASMVPVSHGGYINASQDKVLYSDDIIEFYSLTIPVRVLWGGIQPIPNYTLCLGACSRSALNEELKISAKADNEAHGIVSTYLNEKIFSYETKKRLPVAVVNEVYSAYKALNGRKVNSITISYGVNYASVKIFNKIIALLGIQDAMAQDMSNLSAYVNSSYTIRVDGTGFDSNEAVSIDGSACDTTTIQRGTGYFTQTCQGGSQSGNSNKIRVYDTQYDLDIEVPLAYQFMSLRGPVLAPTAPILTDLGSGTIRSTWGSVAGATGYELYSGQALITTTGASQTTYDHTNRVAGAPVCYRVRTLASGVASAYSADTCITLAAPKCTGQWTIGQFNTGQIESTTQACQAGYTGNKTLSHTCQATGAWGTTTTQDGCSLSAPPPVTTCQGAWSNSTYIVNQTETKTEACTGGQTGNTTTSHTCRSNSTWTPTSTASTCVCPSGQVLLNGICTTPAPTSCMGSWHSQNYAIGVIEDQYANSCPTGTTGQVRQFHTCQAGGIWSPTANSDNCTAYLASPTNLALSSVIGGMQLSWSPASGATRYYIYKNGDGNSYYSSVTGTSWIDSNVVNGQSYSYALKAYSNLNNSSVYSPITGWISKTFEAGNLTINPPQNVAASRFTDGYGRKSIRLTWSTVPSVDSYYIYRKGYVNSNGNGEFLAAVNGVLNGASPEFIDYAQLNLISGMSYCYYMRAAIGNNQSVNSYPDTCSLAP